MPWTLGDVLAKLRTLAGISTQEMADRLGVSRNTVGNYEHDRTHPNRATVEVWGTVTGADWLVDWYGTPDEGIYVGYTENSDHEAFLAGV